ncbi:MAG: hypothetical protein R6U20_11415 [Longimonas sp.]|uniref:hypothetical protein n=1 Tax=Longimonas sp. TaxID=2039626 RepID=UPI003974B507
MLHALKSLRYRTLGWALGAVLITMLAWSPHQAAAQSEMDVEANNSIYTELGGTGFLYTLNYDYRINRDWSARLGAMRAGAFGVTFTNIPLTASYLWGTNHNLEVGLGAMYLGVSLDTEGDDFGGISDDTVAGTAIIGYRYQPTDGGIIFRAGITPAFGDFGIVPWGGLSVGYSF